MLHVTTAAVRLPCGARTKHSQPVGCVIPAPSLVALQPMPCPTPAASVVGSEVTVTALSLLRCLGSHSQPRIQSSEQT